ncbi:HAD-superhydrolase, subIA, variant 3 family protein [Candidatus Endolissoclinum faulkneri L2]|uniref:HAD-superhydrolase, subIA, variant 3 family protein n=1 Tax=Candidatus Endolissoclinum faulkneri L2 TaxID=1193729 RepID=K7Z4Z8_9PROT|nr:pyrimidine 5'-nucleotidase [Candidatus Endolissoclinum faulkneri]AFX99123.1 HAD-superhydrolase, subIA, variant 3 family protein [Candidatus Endolissoclinum faulkneri L2]
MISKTIDCWIFDMDNTLYSPRSNLFIQISDKMTEFIQGKFDLEFTVASDLQEDLFKRYGTTLRGLMMEYNIDPLSFLEFVHNIDVNSIDPAPELEELLAQLPGRKVIYSNGSADHCARVTKRLGVDHHFDHVYDIVASDYSPKPNPAPYDRLISLLSIDPKRTVMIEDIANNLKPAADLGMTTVWLENDFNWAKAGSDQPYVQNVAKDIISFLRDVVKRGK